MKQHADAATSGFQQQWSLLSRSSALRSSEAGVLALQRQVGNAAVASAMTSATSTVQRDLARDVGHLLRDARRGLVGLADPRTNLTRADAFVAHGAYGPQDVIGDAGLGGFSATYVPGTGPGRLTNSMTIAVRFKDLLVTDPSTGLVTPAFPEVAGLAAAINAMPEPARTAAALRYQWSPGERGDGGSWIASLIPLIQGAWGGKFEFFLNLAQHQWIGSTVQIALDVHDRARTATDHMELETFKTPPGESLRTFGLPHQVSRGSGTDARDQSMRLASTSLGPKEYDLLKETVRFDNDSDAITPAATATLTSFIANFDGALGHAAHQEVQVVLESHASSRGTTVYNQGLTDRRAAAVRKFLVDNGFHNVATRVRDDSRGSAGADPINKDTPADRRVDLLVDGGGRMNTATHEFGHAFGLDDEYAHGTTAIGGTASHDVSAAEMTNAAGRYLPGAAIEHNGGIMSWGNEVRERHYATFYKALSQVTTEAEWALGPPRSRAEAQAAADSAAAGGAGPTDAGSPAPTDAGSRSPTDAEPGVAP